MGKHAPGHIENPAISNYSLAMDTAPYIEVRHSPLSGDGAFASEPIPEGTKVIDLSGNIVHRRDLGDDSYNRHIIQIDDDLFLEAMGGADDYINHSCDPSLVFSQDGKSYVSRRGIRKGEELTVDYGTSEDDGAWNVTCCCGAKNCRGVITGFSALSAEVQERLYPFCLPYLKRKYDARKKAA